MRAAFIILLSGLSFLAISCAKDSPQPASKPGQLTDIPEGFDEIKYPSGNEFNKARWLLGKRLFFDPILSADGNVSCGSCHKPHFAFSDDVAFSPGANGAPGTRNAPSLANVAYHPYFTREGRVPTLEMQILVPIQEHNEFNTNIVELAEILSKDQSYIDMSQAAYERNPDPYVITRAIANFERTLISGTSAFDQYYYRGNKMALSPVQKIGLDLFFGKANCSSCHDGFNFTQYAFENNGLYESFDDPGRFRLNRDSADLSRFKVPSLRNVALTAPYMHDGSLLSLTDVVEHYNEGGKNHPNKSSKIKPLHLSEGEVIALVSFLEGLTDYSFITNKLLQP
ncbi:MAG: cytochrome-c peroxidase [Salibacteraceae bacterium]